MGMQLPVNDLHISFQPAEQLGWFIHHFLPAVEITSHVGESDGGGSDIFLAGQLGILVFQKVPETYTLKKAIISKPLMLMLPGYRSPMGSIFCLSMTASNSTSCTEVCELVVQCKMFFTGYCINQKW